MRLSTLGPFSGSRPIRETGQDGRTIGRFGLAARLSISAAAVYQLVLIAQPERFLCGRVLVDDDAYYYFRVARELVEHGRASFDGIHATNGIQYAWAGVVVVLARLLPGELALLRGALGACVALNVAAGLLFERLARAIHSPAAGFLCAVAWSGAMLAGGPTLTGMEYSLAVCLVLAGARMAWILWRSPAPPGSGAFAAGILVPALLVWTRLDAVPFALAIWFLLARAVRREPAAAARRRRLLILAGGILVAGVLYLLVSQWLAGTWTPISGSVKRHLAATHFAGRSASLAVARHLLWWLSIPLRATVGLLDPWSQHGPLPGRLWSLGAGAALLAALLLGLLRARSRQAPPRDREIALALLAMLGLGLAHAGWMVVVLGHFAHVTTHYFAGLAVAVTLAAGFLIARAAWPAPRLRSAGLVLVALWLAVAVADARRGLDGNLRVRRLELARWIDGHLPPAARIGAWNAGELGYFSRRSVVNLDGLVNDRAYLDFLRSGRPVREYLDREGIEYLADYDASDLSMPFRFTWDHARSFRGAIPWSDLEVLRADTGTKPPIYLTRLRRKVD